MKTFENKQTRLTDNEVPLNYADLALLCLNLIPQGGLSPLEMVNRMRVIEPLQNMEVGSTIELEDTPYTTLVECVKNMRWARIHEDIIVFNKYLGAC